MNSNKYILLVMLTFCSCKKLVTRSNKDFIGYWTVRPFTYDNIVSIDEDNDAEYYSEGNSSSVEDDLSIKGKARCNGDKLKIGAWHKFHIDEAPHEIDTTSLNWIPGLSKPNWQMKLNGTVYYSKK